MRFGDLGRMPRRIVHPTQPHDRGWTNWIFRRLGSLARPPSRLRDGPGPLAGCYRHFGQPWIYGILERRVWLARLVAQLQRFKTS